MNSKEYGYPLSKKGYLRGYIKYGIFAYVAWHTLTVGFGGSGHGHAAHHDDHNGHAAAGLNDSHGYHAEKENHAKH